MSDYSPPYTDEDAKLDRRRDKANAKLLNTKLSALTVGDFFIIQEAYKHGYLATSDRYISQIEGILKRANDKGTD